MKYRLERGQSTQEDKEFYIDTFFGGMERLRALARAVENSNAINLICSKGLTYQIQQLCLLVFSPQLFYKLFQGIHARLSEHQLPSDLQKDKLILDLIHNYGIKTMIYFDDDPCDHERLVSVNRQSVETVSMSSMVFRHTYINNCAYYYYKNTPTGFDFNKYGVKLKLLNANESIV